MDEIAFGRYRLLSLIGEGGMGRVYRAHDTVIGRDVAIKVLSTELGTEPGYRERFRREAHIAARLAEPHIIPIYDTGEIDGQLYLVMPVIEGVDVLELLRRDGPMDPPRAVAVIQQLASALDAAHAVGLVHRDVKPSNALLTGRDFVYLIDFGIAHDSAATRLTRTGTIVGSWAYMAPERFTTGVADARADVYALACVLFECLTGAQPYPGNSLEQQFAGHFSLAPPVPSSVDPTVPVGFDEVITRGLAKDPDHRYQSADELAVAAQDALATTQSVRKPGRSALDPTRQDVSDRAIPSVEQPRPARAETRPVDQARTQIATPQTELGRRKKWLLIAMVVVVAVAAVVLLGNLLRTSPAPATSMPEPSGSSVAASSSSVAERPATNRVEVRLYNISSQPGIASIAADELKAAGFNVTEVTNLAVSDVSATTVYYGEESEKATAEGVGKKLNAPVEKRISALADQPPGVIVLVMG